MHDLVIRGGLVATAFGAVRCDVGVAQGRIATLAEHITGGENVIDAGGLLVLPGGVDSHCHIEEPREDGGVMEESFITASRAAFAGGTTSVVSFIPQWKGHGVWDRFEDYRARAARGMLDHAFHQIISDPTDHVLHEEVPRLVAEGVRSLKLFLTYEPLHVNDAQYIRVLETARKLGCLVTVHCENYDAIRWRSQRLLEAGMIGPRYHAWSRPSVVEREATHRAIALAELVDQPIQIFHVSCAEAAEEIARAQARGIKVWGETCPQYFTLTAEHMARPDGALFMCSPAPRGADEHARIWEVIRQGTLDVVSSDHCAFSVAAKRGDDFSQIPNGIPGLAARMPLVFSEGVSKGRIGIEDFVRLTSTNPAKLMGLYPKKGVIQPGSDADLVLWDPRKQVRITNALMQHVVDNTPFEGMEVTGWPFMTIRRGEVVMRDGQVQAEPGTGRYLPRAAYDMVRPRGVTANGFGAGV
ncbi:MAG: dihydropyrimidinase [Alphaproteobacteria bacterium]|nr:dihydropyrimidinase [Alphaproteobacteria bacterium]